MLLSEVHTKIGAEIADPNFIIITKVHITDWVNEAIRRIARQTGENEVETTIPVVAGTESYALPAGAFAIQRIENPSAQKLERVTFESFEKMGLDPLQLSTPIYWYEHNERVYFWPIPSANATYKLWYAGIPTALITPTNDAAQLPLPESYHDTVVTFVRMRANERLGDLDSALFARTEFDERTAEDRQEASTPERNEYPAIAPHDPVGMIWD